jgi:3-hydroxyisobutyrate dehydrogenase-like beta-hydroxyacid dehydrogenase
MPSTGARPTADDCAKFHLEIHFMSDLSLGFIGLGHMGGPMAARLLAAGYRLTVCDTVAANVQPLVAQGATAVATAAEVASEADVVFVSLPTPEVVEQVALGPQGVAQGSRARVLVDLSTTGPRTSDRIATALARGGRVVLLDSPVSGGVAGAKAGKLTLMVAGPRAVYDELVPVLNHFGKMFFCGEKAGLGQTVKLANNLMSAAALAVSCEALVMGAKAGVDPQVMIDVISVSSGRNAALTDKVPKHILTRGFDFGFSTGLSHKDTRLCVEEAEAMGLPMIMGAAVRQVLTMTKSAYGAQADFTNMIRLFEEWAGVEVHPAAA